MPAKAPPKRVATLAACAGGWILLAYVLTKRARLRRSLGVPRPPDPPEPTPADSPSLAEHEDVQGDEHLWAGTLSEARRPRTEDEMAPESAADTGQDI